MNTSPKSAAALAPVLIDGQWRPSVACGAFQAEDPARREIIAGTFPISSWTDCDDALAAAARAAVELRRTAPERLAQFLERFAAAIEQHAEPIVTLAHKETALPVKPRLAEVELPRTIGQLRQAAAAARDGSWALATIDSKANIRSCLAPLGPVCVFGPNNFPLAFNSISGGDFAAAIAAGNPVIAKANTSHPGVTRELAELAHQAAQECDLPGGTVQLLYRLEHQDGQRLVADTRLGATGYTGSREAGLTLKAAADAAGKPIYLELSSVNPVVMLPSALSERGEALVDEFTTSCLMGTGQFCTNPGLLLLLAGPETESWIKSLAARFSKSPIGTLLSSRVARSLERSVQALLAAGAELLAGGTPGGGAGCSFANTLLRVSAARFLERPAALQTEAFGNASLLVVADDAPQAQALLDALEGNLTGSIYSAHDGRDDALYDALVDHLRPRVGRLLNDKMPTGVAVSSAMNHGGPYPATGHPGFTAVGIPASLRRFAMLQSFDNVRPNRLPALLRDKNPTGKTWRLVDGQWSQGDVGA